MNSFKCPVCGVNQYASEKCFAEGVNKMDDKFHVDYLPNAKMIIINLPEEVWRNIDTVIMTRLFQEELVVERQKESKVEEL